MNRRPLPYSPDPRESPDSIKRSHLAVSEIDIED